MKPLLSILLLYTLLIGCARENVFEEPPDHPVIDSIYPASGIIGTQVRLYGSGFSLSPSSNTVSINGKTIRVDSPSTASVLLVTITDVTGTGPVHITVNQKEAEGPIFTWQGQGTGPVITKAAQGWNDGSGYFVNVTNLPAQDNDIKLFIGNNEVPISHITRPGHQYYREDQGPQLIIERNEQVENLVGVNYADFMVKVGNTSSNTYRLVIKPWVDLIKTKLGDYILAGGDTAVITGKFFGDRSYPSRVAIFQSGEVSPAPTILSWTNNQIKIKLPEYDFTPEGTVPISIFVANEESYSQYCFWAGVINATATLIAGSDAGFADGSGTNAKFNQPYGIAVNGQGIIYVSDEGNNRIRRITQQGVVTTLTGGSAGFADGTVGTALFNRPQGLALDRDGNLYVADMINNRIRFIYADARVSTLIGNGNAAELWYPSSLAYTGSETIYIADANNHRIRNYEPTGAFGVLAGSNPPGFNDGGAGNAKFDNPYGVAATPVAPYTVYVADAGNHRIRKIVGGQVSTLAGSGTSGKANGTGAAAQFEIPRAITLDDQGNLYVADFFNPRIRKITPAGVVTTITPLMADGSGQLLLGGPTGLAFDAQKNLYVADNAAHKIYKLRLQ